MAKTYGNFTDFIDFSRASSATYLGADGLIKTATDNEPRVEYDANGNVKGLLIEEARTNLVTYSDLSSGWNETRSSLSFNADTSPDGTNNATALSSDLTAANSHRTSSIIGNPLATGVHTFSVWLKRGETNAQVEFYVDPANTIQLRRFFVLFDLENGTAAAPYESGSPTDTDYGIEDWGNGWYRCFVTCGNPDGTRVDANITLTTGSGSTANPTFDGTGNIGIYIYGAQLEEGSFPTSYIPTSGSTATRAADIASIATSNFGYNKKAGTVVVEFSHLGRPTSTNIGVIYGGATNARWVYSNTGSNNHYTYDGTTPITHGSIPVGQVSKLAVAVNSTTQQSSLDGASVVSGSHNGNISQNTTAFNIGTNHVSSDVMSGHIKSLSYRPRRNTNTQIQEFTS